MNAETQALERKIQETLGLHIMLELSDGHVTVSGPIDTDEARGNVLDMVSEALPGIEVDDNLEIAVALAADIDGLAIDESAVGSLPGANEDFSDSMESLEAGDFNDQDSLAYPEAAAGPSSSLDRDRVSEGDAVYVPPTDPVGTNTEVIGGLSRTSLDSVEVERSALDGRPGDEALRDAILRELREDAATTSLEIDVSVDRGTARLRGRVADLDDAENAEEVAARVPGLVEVIDETVVEAFER